MSTVRQIIARKTEVHTIAPSATVLDALQVMAAKDVGALVVLDGERIAGIFSERDYARKVILHGKSSRELTVGEIMSSPVVCAEPAWSAYDCMGMMTQWRVRHLPVVEDGRMIGLISIGDVVKAVVDEQATTIRNLEDYIASGS
jgi:CBS domain-containing protein